MKIKELMRRRELRKIPIDKNKVEGSLKTAEMKINEARELFNEGFFNQVIISAYTSMFHSGRAILYNRGYQEKSHYSVFVYLNEKYGDKIPKSLLLSFDNYRSERHKVLYGFEYKISKEEAEIVVSDSEKFLNKVKEILNYRL